MGTEIRSVSIKTRSESRADAESKIKISERTERCAVCGPKTTTDRENRIDQVKILLESDWPQKSDAIASSGRFEIL